MMNNPSTFLRLTFALSLLFLTTMVSAGDTKPSGTIVIDETQVMALIGGTLGGGTLLLENNSYSFKTGGISLGASAGVHKIHPPGKVYHLKEVADFPGTYFEAEAAITVVEGVGGLWLENKHGVTLHLVASDKGLALAIGAEGLRITMK